MSQMISADPDPVSQGAQLEVCFDFVGASSPVVLTLDYFGADNEQIELDTSKPCKTVTVPQTATSLTIVDTSGQSEDLGVTIQK